MIPGEGPTVTGRMVQVALALLLVVIILQIVVSIIAAIWAWLVGALLLAVVTIGIWVYLSYRKTHW